MLAPTYNKLAHIEGFPGVFHTSWTLAMEYLSEADEIIIIGYSLPPTDYDARCIFRRAFQKSFQDLMLHIVNPNPGPVVGGFADLCRGKNVTWRFHKNLREFLKSRTW